MYENDRQMVNFWKIQSNFNIQNSISLRKKLINKGNR